jgi:glycosyltransferase involved in cell wall biosynthesis
MKIAVCIPSLNEKDNIKNITQIIDQGLVDLISIYPDAQTEIINFDSNSSDGTPDIFISTETKSSKRSEIIKNAAGKGKNIIEFCRYAVENNIDYCLTIDSDIISATSDWVIKLIKPLINNDADYVTPIYERSRFEGSSTNHFTYPLVYAFTGNVIRQPIAGDFAFTKKIALAIYENKIHENKSIQRYGIDIFMTLTAISVSGKIYQVDLGKKIHSPSFNKLEYMFPQIASSFLLTVSSVNFIHKNISEVTTKSNILSNLQFLHKKSAQEMKNNALTILNAVSGLEWADLDLLLRYKKTFSMMSMDENEMMDLWTSILSSWINYFSKLNLTPSLAKKAGDELLPFFVLRATNFWLWAETVEVSKVELAIRKQSEVLKEKLNNI